MRMAGKKLKLDMAFPRYDARDGGKERVSREGQGKKDPRGQQGETQGDVRCGLSIPKIEAHAGK